MVVGSSTTTPRFSKIIFVNSVKEHREETCSYLHRHFNYDGEVTHAHCARVENIQPSRH